jgi:hypothetical protein
MAASSRGLCVFCDSASSLSFVAVGAWLQAADLLLVAVGCRCCALLSAFQLCAGT